MIITVGGLPASGKSVVAKILAKKLHFKHYSAGDIMRKVALDKGITINELQNVREKTKEFDRMVDEYQAKLGKEEDNFVIDGRTSFYFIPSSFKVFFTVDIKVAAVRLLKDKKRKGELSYKNLNEAIKAIKKRIADDRRLYKKYYNIDYTNKSNYNLIVDTTNLTIKEVAAKVLKAIPTSGIRV